MLTIVMLPSWRICYAESPLSLNIVDELMQKICKSSVLAMELRLFCIDPLVPQYKLKLHQILMVNVWILIVMSTGVYFKKDQWI